MLKGVQRGSWEIVFRLVVCSFSTLEAHLRASTLIEVNYVAGGWSFVKKCLKYNVKLVFRKLKIFQRRPTTVTMKETRRHKIIGNAPL
jgi:hypothetical protein